MSEQSTGATGTSPTSAERSPPAIARLVLLLGILTGVVSIVLTPFANSDQLMLASDVYFHAGETHLDGESFYDVAPPDRDGFYYLYPPITILVFLPHAFLGSEVASFLLQTLLNLGFGIALATVIWRALDRRGLAITRVDRLLLVGFALVSAHSAINLVNGQVNIWLAFALAIGFDALDRQAGVDESGQSTSSADERASRLPGIGRSELAGVAFAVAALVKIFPTLLGLWLVRLRAWRGVAAAIATGLGGLVLGLVAFGPDLTVTYFEDVLLARYEEQAFEGRPDPTQTTDGFPRQLAALGVPSSLQTLLSGAILAPVVAALYRDVGTDVRRQAAVLGTVIAMLLLFPLPSLYFPLLAFPLVVLLYVLPAGWPRRVLVVGVLVSYVRTDYALAADVVTAVGLPSSLETPLLSALETLFTFVLPPTLGLWILLGACLLVHWRDTRT